MQCKVHIQTNQARGLESDFASFSIRLTVSASLRPLKVDELHSPVKIKKREVFNELIQRRWGSPMTPSNIQQQNVFEKYKDHEHHQQATLDVADIVDSSGKLINQQPAHDQIVNAEVQLQLGEEMVTGKVTQRTIGSDEQVTGTYGNNPYLNSINYDVEFPKNSTYRIIKVPCNEKQVKIT